VITKKRDHGKRREGRQNQNQNGLDAESGVGGKERVGGRKVFVHIDIIIKRFEREGSNCYEDQGMRYVSTRGDTHVR